MSAITELFPGDIERDLYQAGGDSRVPASVIERETRLQETLAIVEAVSEQAGNELNLYAIKDPTDIPHEPGIYVLGEYTDCGPVTATTFEMEGILLSGARNSGHSIIPGRLGVEYADGTQRDIEVAAKCFAKRAPGERFERAMREILVSQEMADRGEIALEPIALVVSEESGQTDGEIVLVTRHRRGLLSLDNIPWVQGPESHTNMQDAYLALQALGRFNAYGFRHGDAKFKNSVVEESLGALGFGMLDFETTTRFNPDDSGEAGTTAFIDAASMLNSLRKKGFFAPVIGDVALQAVVDDLSDGYLSGWSESSPAVSDAVTDSVVTVGEQLIKQLEPVVSKFNGAQGSST